MAAVGPGARLRVWDAGATRSPATDEPVRTYEGYSSATDNDLLLETEAVLLVFDAEEGALAARGPDVSVQVASIETGMSADTVRRIIFGGTFALIGVYIISAIIAWRRFRVQEDRRRDTERDAARCVTSVAWAASRTGPGSRGLRGDAALVPATRHVTLPC